MARTPEQNIRMTQATKAKIMAVALQLFAQKGFAMTNIKDIAQTAGISTGLIYRHFPSKDELFDELIGDTIQELTKATQLLDSNTSPRQVFEKLASSLLADIQSSEELSCYFLLVTRSIIEEVALPQMAELRKKDLILFDKAAQLIEKGQQLGEFRRGNPYKLALLFFSVIQGMANMKQFMGDQYIAPEIDDVMTILIEVV